MIDLIKLHEAAAGETVEVDLGIIDHSKNWLNLSSNTPCRLSLAITRKKEVFFYIQNLHERQDNIIKDAEFNIKDGQIMIDELYRRESFVDSFGCRHFSGQHVLHIFGES
jgi:hypothetical protein